MTLRAAVMGTGGWAGQAHLPALRQLPGVEVVACCGLTLEEAASFGRPHGLAAYEDLDRMLGELSLDLVTVATPDDVHPAAVRACLAAGVAVFCEKPLANDAATARELAALEASSGGLATVGYSFRYSPAVQALRSDLSAGRLGEPWFLELFEHNAQFHPRLGKPMNWKGDPAHSAGGALFEYGSHVLDLGEWLLGPVSGVSANLPRVLPGARLDDIASLQLRFAGGASGTLLASWLLTGGFPGIRLRLHGSEGLAEVQLNDTFEGGERYRAYDLGGRPQPPHALPGVSEGSAAYTLRHLRDFVAAVGGAGRSADLPTLGQAASTQDVLDTSLRAHERWLDPHPAS